MTPSRALARNYLRPSPHSYWRWREGGKVVTWADGATIAFRSEIASVLDRLAGAGLPPFGSIVLYLAACRRSPAGPLRAAGEQHWLIGKLRALGYGLADHHLAVLSAGLERLSALPADVVADSDGKAALAELIFAAVADRGTRDDAARIAAAFAGLGADDIAGAAAGDGGLDALKRDLRVLEQGLNYLDSEPAVRLYRRTGLDRLVRAAPEGLVSPLAVRRLLDRFRSDRQFSRLARLARDLMAAVFIPRAISAPR